MIIFFYSCERFFDFENFESIIDPDEIFHDFSFKNYVAKNPVIDERIILNGNRLFFLEPLEATALSVYMYWIRYTYDWIILKNTHPKEISSIIKKLIHEVENFVLYHYLHGSNSKDYGIWELISFKQMYDGLQTKDLNT